MDQEQSTEELKALQLEKETAEHKLAQSSSDESEAAQHARRAAKARYLRQKLEEQAQSDRESAASPDDHAAADQRST